MKRDLGSLAALLAFCSGMAMAQDVPAAVDADLEDALPDHFLYMLTASEDGSPEGMQQNIDGQKLWDKGQVLRVCFFGGSPAVRALIAQVAPQWSGPSGLGFDFGAALNMRDCAAPSTGFSHIRIGFSAPGRWSLIGRDSISLSGQLQPSMNLSRFDQIYSPANGMTPANVLSRSEAKDRGTILHEFGHAIGLLHEHQNKNLNCWNELILEGAETVFTYYAAPPNNWSEDKVRRNLGLITLTDPGAVSGTPDPKSIMGYFLPDKILKTGKNSKCYIAARANEISNLDKSWVTAFYQGAAEPAEDTELAGGVLSSIPAAAPEGLKEDYLQRLLVDLESGDTAVRRDARARLGDFLTTTNDPEIVDRITAALDSASYRTQLGIAVAVSRLPQGKVSAKSLDAIRDLQLKTQDPTLRDNLNKVIENQ